MKEYRVIGAEWIESVEGYGYWEYEFEEIEKKEKECMGMDLSISRKRNIGTPNEESVEVYYARKFWELLNAPFVVEYNDSKENCYVRARIQSKEDIEQLIDIAVHNRDYWDTFDSVPQLCELLDEFEDMKEDGWNYVLEADW